MGFARTAAAGGEGEDQGEAEGVAHRVKMPELAGFVSGGNCGLGGIPRVWFYRKRAGESAAISVALALGGVPVIRSAASWLAAGLD